VTVWLVTREMGGDVCSIGNCGVCSSVVGSYVIGSCGIGINVSGVGLFLLR